MKMLEEFESMKPEVKFISATPDAVKHMYRKSFKSNRMKTLLFAGLLKYCIQHQHWSQSLNRSSLTVEINTTRGIAAQILRHRSFTFQEFSQRYADTGLLSKSIPLPELRRQDTKNRQNSIDDIPDYLKLVLLEDIRVLFEHSQSIYNRLLDKGVAKECARFVLPLATPTRLYMTGSVRSWIHYIDLRSAHGTQKEHMEIAEAIRCIFTCQFPAVSEALGWTRETVQSVWMPHLSLSNKYFRYN
jgi:thymidylate synthase (FAD)